VRSRSINGGVSKVARLVFRGVMYSVVHKKRLAVELDDTKSGSGHAQGRQSVSTAVGVEDQGRSECGMRRIEKSRQ